MIFLIQMILEDDDRYKEGGLHYLASCESPRIFWAMAINFNTFGTVAPFHPDCLCKYNKIPPKWKELRKKWNKIFKRVKEQEDDIQCMFSDTPLGCHAYKKGCLYKHHVYV